MDLKATCQCGQRLRVPSGFSGKRLKCPKCGHLVRLPDADIPHVDVEPKPPKTQSAVVPAHRESTARRPPMPRSKLLAISGAGAIVVVLAIVVMVVMSRRGQAPANVEQADASQPQPSTNDGPNSSNASKTTSGSFEGKPGQLVDGPAVNRPSTAPLANDDSLAKVIADIPAERSAALETRVSSADLDPAATAEWMEGREHRKSEFRPRQTSPGWVVWTRDETTGNNGTTYGDSEGPGMRHLRLGFRRSVAVGTVLVRGGGTLSVLRPDATYPGDMSDDSQWLAAARLPRQNANDGVTGKMQKMHQVREHNFPEFLEYSTWILPPGVSTRALRFSYDSPSTAGAHLAWLGGVYLLSDRFVNVAPRGTAITSVNRDNGTKLNNGRRDQRNWDNGLQGGAQTVSQEHPEWVLLAWDQPVELRGLGLIDPLLGSVEVHSFQGTDDQHPREANEAAWNLITTARTTPSRQSLDVAWIDFKQVITTRAVRLRITGSALATATRAQEKQFRQQSFDGKRIELTEILAMQPLREANLESLLATKPEGPHPPIPVPLTMSEAGIVTLVIDDSNGKRIRNLVSETSFPAGEHTVWWDGLDESGRINEASGGRYEVQGKLIDPGRYRVQGLTRQAVDLRYEFSVYSPGNPPWMTVDSRGAWLSDHMPPSDVLFLPAGSGHGEQPLVLVSASNAEAGHGLLWANLKGQKLRGQGTLGSTLAAASHLARDTGRNSISGVSVYTASSIVANAAESPRGELVLFSMTPLGDLEVLRWQVPERSRPASTARSSFYRQRDEKNAARDDARIGGLAVHDGVIAVSLSEAETLVLVQSSAPEPTAAREAKPLGTLLTTTPLDDPRGLAFDPAGRLLVLSANRLLRFQLESKTAKLSKPEVVIASGLEDPQRIIIQDDGTLWISDWGNSHQVKVFTSDGKLKRTIGTPGGPQVGRYDPTRMHVPNGLTITADGQLWVAEADRIPKRISIWSPEGQFVKALYGPPKYGGGGTLDPQDRSRFYYAQKQGGMEFRVDWKSGTWELVNIYSRPGPNDVEFEAEVEAVEVPETPIYVDGRQYMTNAYNAYPTDGARITRLWLMKDGLAVPVAAAGDTRSCEFLQKPEFLSRMPRLPDEPVNSATGKAKKKKADDPVSMLFAWSDLNGDQKVQVAEVTFAPEPVRAVTVDSGLSLLTMQGSRLKPTRFTPSGVPVYEANKPEHLFRETKQISSAAGRKQTLEMAGGWQVFTGGPLTGFRNGELLWTYPNQWPSLGAGHSAPLPQHPGQLIATTRLLGPAIAPRSGDGGPMCAINGDKGNIFLMTADGLFVATLGKDNRTGPGWAMTQSEREMPLNDIHFGSETFWPTITQAVDGQIYLQVGKTHCGLVRVNGLETIRRLPSTALEITPDTLQLAEAFFAERDARRQSKSGRDTLQVAIRKQSLTVDGQLDDWSGAEWVNLDERTSAAITVSNDRLFAAFRTDDRNLLDNTGSQWETYFKTGGALDLMISTRPENDTKHDKPRDGDLRLLVTQIKGASKAILYRPVVSGPKKPTSFKSPWRSITFDRVDDVSSKVKLATNNRGDYELSFPLTDLRLQPSADLAIVGDIGVLRGQNGETVQRLYWHNKSTGLVNDIPGEALLTPALWGRWRFVAP